MGTFHIKSTDIDDTMWEISGKFEELMLHCSYYKEYINTFVAQQAFTGGGADAMKTYLTEVHGFLDRFCGDYSPGNPRPIYYIPTRLSIYRNMRVTRRHIR